MSDQLTFAAPQWLYLILLAVPLFAVKVIAANAARAGLEKLTSERLREHLITAQRPLGDWGRFALQILGLALIATALARPQKGFTEEMIRVEGRNLIIAIDTSRSMLAQDILPDRLSQAKLAAIDLIRELPEDRIGLIAFAGTAFMFAPMTPDHGAVIETVEQLNTYVIQRGGTNLSAAIKLARQRFAQTAAARSALIIFTDGDDLEGAALSAAKAASDDDIVIVTIGVGLSTPSIVPDPEGASGDSFLRDASGELVKSGMDAESLEKIAKATNGIFVNLQGGLMNNRVVSEVLSNISYSQSEDKLKRIPREHFAIPLSAGLGCIACAFIATLWGSRPAARQAIAALLVLGAFLATGAQASTEEEAYAAFEEGDFPAAEQAYDRAAKEIKDRKKLQQLSFGRGAAAYRNGDYDEAINAFAAALVTDDPSLQERSHYNLGNTLFRKGEILWKDEENGGVQQIDAVVREWEDAADHYRSTLDINAQNEDAKANLDIAEALLAKLKELKEEPEEEAPPKVEPKEEEPPKEEPEEAEPKEEPKEEEPEAEEPKQEEPKEEAPEKEAPEEEEKSGESEEQPKQEAEGEGEQQETPDGESEGESEETSEPNPGGEAQAGDPEAGGKEEEAPAGEPVPDPDDVVNEDTGYSKNEAREHLRELSDEQGLGLIRRRRLHQNSSRYKDW